jgi:hypothetical protein
MAAALGKGGREEGRGTEGRESGTRKWVCVIVKYQGPFLTLPSSLPPSLPPSTEMMKEMYPGVKGRLVDLCR